MEPRFPAARLDQAIGLGKWGVLLVRLAPRVEPFFHFRIRDDPAGFDVLDSGRDLLEVPALNFNVVAKRILAKPSSRAVDGFSDFVEFADEIRSDPYCHTLFCCSHGDISITRVQSYVKVSAVPDKDRIRNPAIPGNNFKNVYG